MIKNLAINLGSTSTKIAYYEDGECKIRDNLQHDPEQIMQFKDIWEQYDLRKKAIDGFLTAHNIKVEELNAFSSRGGHTEPIPGGTYRINEAMLRQNRTGKYGYHVGNLGIEIVYEYTKNCPNTLATVTNLPSTDEFEPLARFSGLAEIQRVSNFQALNHKAMAQYYAESIGKKYEELNLVVAMLGGGITVVAHKKGKMVDGPNGLVGDGPFSNNRCGAVPVGPLVQLCYSGKYTEKEMMRKINGQGGLVSYLGTTDIRAIQKNAEEGDEKSSMVLDAMCYQIAKEIGAQSTVLKGQVDVILLTGGMANSQYITRKIRERVDFIAPVVILPGEREMESLCLSAYRVLIGEEELKEFVPSEEV